jgi:hypothetical protein
MLSELEAWKYLKDCWANVIFMDKYGEFSDLPLDYRHQGDGLCITIDNMWDTKKIDDRVRHSMLNKICKLPFNVDRHKSYKFPLNGEGAQMRVEFCDKMIAELTT